MIVWVLLAGCKGAMTPPVDPPSPTEPTVSEADADSDADTDTDTDTDTDADTDTASHTGDTGVPHPTGDTGRFAVSCDTADTGSLAGLPDCDGECYAAGFVGDGVFCDDGTPRPWGAPDFNCAAFAFDGGDCPPP